MEEESKILQSVFEMANSRRRDLHSTPILPSKEEIEAALKELPDALPKTGIGMTRTFQLVKDHLLPALTIGQAGPRYFGFVTGAPLPEAQFGDFLTTIYNQNGMTHLPMESIHSMIEACALEMVLQLLRLPPERFTGRTLTTGATASNLLGLACARDHAVRTALNSQAYSVAEDGFGGVPVTIFADRAHQSLIKSAAIVGIGRKNVIELGTDLLKMEEQLKGYTPGSGKGAIVSLSFGEVNTGDFTSDVTAIRKLCDKYSVWLHIDAAFGAFARLSPLTSDFADALELADSITVDAHKWLNVPYDCGIFFTRFIEHQLSVFGNSPSSGLPAYLKAPDVDQESLSPEIARAMTISPPLSLGIENSRRFRALPLYCALLSLGEDGYRELIERNVGFARSIAEWMTEGEGSKWYEVMNSAQIQGRTTVPLQIVLFRARESCPIPSFRPSNHLAISTLASAIKGTKKMYVSPGAGGLRIAVSNWSTGLRADGEGRIDLDIVKDCLREVMQAPSTEY